ncbi:LPXTG cell wall anchor domain-containing protein [Adlercreutzia shanghongiae]|uniref:LPXTG cell wall anchor domain-containing protein n=1 Tax=Adlercreutzia shanghongiae TaxID=3111773 RepID=A0ABU6J0K3_9ACTN|nr:LPXTG cell wall anchor domain-containing protein [Adlercreutzia sp. R22]MEC4295498.1 LPXTG cell wall anchor domain-containing protein [Adlercreutzia sp. R22]
MVNPKNHPARPVLGSLARKTGSVALAAALSLSMIPSLAFAEGDGATEGSESVEQIAQGGNPKDEKAAGGGLAETTAPTTDDTQTVDKKTESSQSIGQDATQGSKADDSAKPEPEKTSGGSASASPKTDEATPQDTTTETGTRPSMPAGKPFYAEGTFTVTGLPPQAPADKVAQAFEKTVTVTNNGSADAPYTVKFSLSEMGKKMGARIEGAREVPGETGSYQIDVAHFAGSPISFKVAAMGAEADVSLSINPATMSPNPPTASVDKSGLQGMLTAAKNMEQGQKSDEAWKALQDAIKAAEATANNANATEAEVGKAAAALGMALKSFNASEDVKPSTPDTEKPNGPDTQKPGVAEEGAVKTPDGFMLVKDKAYTLAKNIIKEDGTTSVADSYFEPNVSITWNGSSYDIVVTVKEDGRQYIKTIDGAKDLGNGKWKMTSKTIADRIPMKFLLEVPQIGSMPQTAYLVLTTSSLPTASGEPIESEKPKDDNKKNESTNNSNNSNKTDNTTSNAKAAKFQVGHTYRVPIKFTKENGTETSMAAKYFGGTAIVRPKSNGTFDVTFAATSDGLQYITSLKYKGKNLSRSGDQFTVNIPAVDRDTTVPIEMDITMLKSMGITDPVTSDLHLYLSRAEDLGTNASGTKASSSPALAQTGDEQNATGLITLAALAAGAVVVAGRRRFEDLSE